MKLVLVFLLFLCTILTRGQTLGWIDDALLFNPEFLVGQTIEANDNFPKTKFQKQIIVNIGRYQDSNLQEWAIRLKEPKTGYSFAITDFGNIDRLGLAFTLMPFIEVKAFGSERISILAGLGASYITKKYDPITNPTNQAVTTNITWAYRTYLYYRFLSVKNSDWRIGFGYTHHSNGHTRLHNKGYNSYLVSLSTAIKSSKAALKPITIDTILKPNRSIYYYISTRAGLGQNSFSMAFNNAKNVYTFASEYGTVRNNTLKMGVGFHFRLYEHYYDYIKENEWMVQNGKEFDYFKSAPIFYSTNLGININGELLLNHIGIDLQIGFNLHKPAYKLDWRINNGWENTPREIPNDWTLGTYDVPYTIKNRISGRLGLKYYILGVDKKPKNNFYIAAHINSNLGQADFSELSLGYMYSFKFRSENNPQ